MEKITDSNRLSKTKPVISSEWNYERNGNLTPDNVSYGSHKKVWWKCKNGHEWLCRINDRSNGCGCSYCSGHSVNDQNCLANNNSVLCSEWNYERNGSVTPHNITSGSNKKAWWKCKYGHEWEAIINNRNNGNGCPYCSGQLVCLEKSLQVVNPKLSEEWHMTKNIELKPSDFLPNSHKKVWWKCKYGHEWEYCIANRNRGENCPYCSCHRVCEQNCLATIAPHLLGEWDYDKNVDLSPYNISFACHKNIWWKCKNGHSWQANNSNRVINSTGCPYCGKITLKSGHKFSSLPEAYYYLVYIENKYDNDDVYFDKKYPSLGSYRYDFYIKTKNTYIEVTGYGDHCLGWGQKIWGKYKKTIDKKREHVEKKLGASFVFEQIVMDTQKAKLVRSNEL